MLLQAWSCTAIANLLLYHTTPCSKKGSHQTFGNNFLKSKQILTILSLQKRRQIFPTKLRNILHHTLSMFLHYLGKVSSSNLLQIATEKIKKRVVCDKNETFMLSWLNGDRRIVFYSICWKCPPFACTHAQRRLRHSSIALSMMLWSTLHYTCCTEHH